VKTNLPTVFLAKIF